MEKGRGTKNIPLELLASDSWDYIVFYTINQSEHICWCQLIRYKTKINSDLVNGTFPALVAGYMLGLLNFLPSFDLLCGDFDFIFFVTVI